MNSYTTLSEAIEDLKKHGYTEDLNLRSDCVECKALGYEMFANDFEVDRIFRFEGDSNPDDSSILYAISS
ncbi:MAG: phosphoribosylpyrophosphate synthetase, partial [Bacteroidota bacterium]